MTASSPVLIVASDSTGHRQNYVGVLARWFQEAGHSVVIACGPSEHGLPASQTLMSSRFRENSETGTIDLQKADVQTPARFRARLTQLETELNPTWTLLVNGEECVTALQGEWPRTSSQSRRAANFIYFPHEYPLDLRPYTGFAKLRPWARHWRDRYRRRRFFQREARAKLGLDLMLSMDEHAVAAMALPHLRYLPDIYRAWGSDLGPEPAEIGQARLAYAWFMRRHPGKDALIYYGGRFLRRGYDTLMALALEHHDTVFVSVGRDAPGERFAEEVGRWRTQLAAQDRLCELDLPFLPENSLVDDLFHSARYVILPYRNWYGLSGILLQAAAAGSAVLVPDIGAMAHAVRHYGFGLTYRHLDLQHLRRQFATLRREPARYQANALRFARRMDEPAVFAALATVFGNG